MNWEYKSRFDNANANLVAACVSPHDAVLNTEGAGTVTVSLETYAYLAWIAKKLAQAEA